MNGQQDTLPSSSTKKNILVTKGSMDHLSTPLSSSSTKKKTLVTKGSMAQLSTTLSRNGSSKQIDHHKIFSRNHLLNAVFLNHLALIF